MNNIGLIAQLRNQSKPYSIKIEVEYSYDYDEGCYLDPKHEA